ncbi:MAG: HD domain-containing phosphohydrolase [Acidobacteriota bacterium]|nr:GAF domain-containing protein [Blastocatellia bacterium]MDW8412565.1 HD domain-containing phosphohydrolase [Acidobacteriota bacterium]
MLNTIYYLAGHGLERLVSSLNDTYNLVAVSDEHQAAEVDGLLFASADRLGDSSPLFNFTAKCFLVLVADDEQLKRLSQRAMSASGTIISPHSPVPVLRKRVQNILDLFDMRATTETAQISLRKKTNVTKELNKIGIALSSQRDPQKLLNLIVEKAMELTSSDAASLYLVEKGEDGKDRLRFKYTKNYSIEVGFQEFTIPISNASIAGFVAEVGIPLAIDDVYCLPAEAPYAFNKSFDEKTGYITRSMLVVPMLNAFNSVMGVLQLINHKTDPQAIINSKEAADLYVRPYSEELTEIASSLASQAAVALENFLLYQNIKQLFEGFVNASVIAIEQRDPTTSGHSFRVADLTVALAKVVDRVEVGKFASVKFTPDQITEIKYASLLHDFGKVGVREEVLVKAKKLYPLQFEVIKWKFDFYKLSLQLKASQRKLKYLMEKGLEDYLRKLSEMDSELEAELQRVSRMWDLVIRSNEPTVLPEGSFDQLNEIGLVEFFDLEGRSVPLLSRSEIKTLSIPKGSLNEEERREIEQHAYHTFVFLSQIPWTEEWKNIPLIAGYHHEKLDGSGYPYRLRGNEIPIQSRMMTISDIFDALTASDRPYKRAVPVPKALDILQQSVKDGHIDGDLYELFVEAKIYELVSKPK